MKLSSAVEVLSKYHRPSEKIVKSFLSLVTTRQQKAKEEKV